MQYVDQSSSQPIHQQPNDKQSNSSGQKKKKTGLKIAIIVICAVLLIGAGVTAAFFYMTEKKDKEAASSTASEFIKTYGIQDVNSLQEYFPVRIKKADEIIKFTDEPNYLGMRYYSYTIKDIEVADAQKYSTETAASDVAGAYNKHLNIKNSYSVSVKYTETYEKDGKTVENTLTDNVICGKIDEKWYVLDPALISKKNQIVADFDKEADEDQSKAVVEALMTSITESTHEGLEACFATAIYNSDSMKEGREALAESFDKLNEFGIKVTVDKFSVSEPEEYDAKKAKDSIKNDYQIEPDFDKCRRITVDYSVTIEVDGESTSKDATEEFICGEDKGEWYIYNSDIITDYISLFADVIIEKETAKDEEEINALIYDFVESLALLDIDRLKSTMPEEVLNIEDIASSIDELESEKDEIDAYGAVLALDSIDIGALTEENPITVMIKIFAGYDNMVLDIEKAYSTTVTFSHSVSYNGKTQYHDIESYMVCTKINGKWYVVHAGVSEDE